MASMLDLDSSFVHLTRGGQVTTMMDDSVLLMENNEEKESWQEKGKVSHKLQFENVSRLNKLLIYLGFFLFPTSNKRQFHG